MVRGRDRASARAASEITRIIGSSIRLGNKADSTVRAHPRARASCCPKMRGHTDPSRAIAGLKGTTTRLTAPAYWKFESIFLQRRVRRTSVRGWSKAKAACLSERFSGPLPRLGKKKGRGNPVLLVCGGGAPCYAGPVGRCDGMLQFTCRASRSHGRRGGVY